MLDNHVAGFFSVDFKSLFSKEALYRKIKEQGKSVIKQVTSQLIDEFLKLLKIAKVKTNYIKYNYLKINVTINFAKSAGHSFSYTLKDCTFGLFEPITIVMLNVHQLVIEK